MNYPVLTIGFQCAGTICHSDDLGAAANAAILCQPIPPVFSAEVRILQTRILLLSYSHVRQYFSDCDPPPALWWR